MCNLFVGKGRLLLFLHNDLVCCSLPTSHYVFTKEKREVCFKPVRQLRSLPTATARHVGLECFLEDEIPRGSVFPHPNRLSHRMGWNVVLFEQATRGREGGHGEDRTFFWWRRLRPCSHQIAALFFLQDGSASPLEGERIACLA